MNGKLLKLMIVAFGDADYRCPTGEAYVTAINPEQYQEQVQVNYCDTQPLGASAAQLKYRGTRPQTMKFTFHFDATGALPDTTVAGVPIPVPAQIELFRRVTLDFKGDIHSPRYVKILWGTLIFPSRLSELSISYTLFNSAGIPLRAQAEAAFKESVSPKKRTLQERRSSPDLTHVRIVKQGDTLPNLAHEIYGDPSYFVEVARVNKLTGFRRLEPGARLLFPPVDTDGSASKAT